MRASRAGFGQWRKPHLYMKGGAWLVRPSFDSGRDWLAVGWASLTNKRRALGASPARTVCPHRTGSSSGVGDAPSVHGRAGGAAAALSTTGQSCSGPSNHFDACAPATGGDGPGASTAT